MLESNLVEYEEARLIVRQYKVLVSTLTEQERDLLKTIIFEVNFHLIIKDIGLEKYIIIGLRSYFLMV